MIFQSGFNVNWILDNILRELLGMQTEGDQFQVTNRGTKFYDSSGAKVNAVIPTIPKAEYGPVYLLVLAQGMIHDIVLGILGYFRVH